MLNRLLKRKPGSKRPGKDIIEGYEYKEEEKTITQVVDALKKEGYTAEFRINDEGQLQAYGNDEKTWRPEDVVIDDFFRFEGVSNPDDMAILYVIECNDGTKGTISNSYGTYADEEIDAFLNAVPDTEESSKDTEAEEH